MEESVLIHAFILRDCPHYNSQICHCDGAKFFCVAMLIWARAGGNSPSEINFSSKNPAHRELILIYAASQTMAACEVACFIADLMLRFLCHKLRAFIVLLNLYIVNVYNRVCNPTCIYIA